MRKKIMLGAILLTAAIGASASVGFISSCGVQVCTVSEEYFESTADMEEYYLELNDILCGPGSSDYTIIP